MKLISLNIWGGRVYKPLVDFIRQYRETDIFCFQEVYNTSTGKKFYNQLRVNILQEICQILPDFQVFYFPYLPGFETDSPESVDFNLEYGCAIFVNKKININSYKNYFIYKDKSFKKLKSDFSNLPIPLQSINFSVGNKKFSIFNFHGTPFPANKLDSPKRLKETGKVAQIVNNATGPKILVGDFNLLPWTKSIETIEKKLTNLVTRYNIPRTRSNLSPYFGKVEFQNFADYIFTSPDIIVNNFQVLEVEISDHLPLIVEFE